MARTYPTTPMCNGDILAAFEPTARDSDVFTTTIAKCGQTWLCALLYHLKTGGRSPDFAGRALHEVVPWLEIPTQPGAKEKRVYEVGSRIAEFEAMPDPRVFKMHVIWDEVPRPPGCRAKVITVTRDPRDVPYSMYCHLKAMETGPFADGAPPFETYFETWMDNGFYFRFVDNLLPHQEDPDLLWLRYEDMQADIEREARKILKFLDWEVSLEDFARAVPLASFRHMSATESLVLGGSTAFSRGKFIRQGAMGKNRAQLSPQMESRIVSAIRDGYPAELADHLLALG